MSGWGTWTRRDPQPRREADQAIQGAHVGMMIAFEIGKPATREEQIARRERAVREMAAACNRWLAAFGSGGSEP